MADIIFDNILPFFPAACKEHFNYSSIIYEMQKAQGGEKRSCAYFLYRTD